VVSELVGADEIENLLRFPRTQWKALWTTNALERINGEFRRRTKAQAELPGNHAVLLPLASVLNQSLQCAYFSAT
jgi:transposase-like protein